MAMLRRQDIPILAGIATCAVSCFLGSATLFLILFAIGARHSLLRFLTAGGLALILLGSVVLAWGVARYLRRRQQPTVPDQQWPY